MHKIDLRHCSFELLHHSQLADIAGPVVGFYSEMLKFYVLLKNVSVEINKLSVLSLCLEGKAIYCRISYKLMI